MMKSFIRRCRSMRHGTGHIEHGGLRSSHQFSFDHHHEYVKYYTPSHTADFTSNLYI